MVCFLYVCGNGLFTMLSDIGQHCKIVDTIAAMLTRALREGTWPRGGDRGPVGG